MHAREGALAIGHCRRETQSRMWITTVFRLNQRLGWNTHGESDVGAQHRVTRQLFFQKLARLGGFRDNKQTRGIAVDPMNYPRTKLSLGVSWISDITLETCSR